MKLSIEYIHRVDPILVSDASRISASLKHRID